MRRRCTGLVAAWPAVVVAFGAALAGMIASPATAASEAQIASGTPDAPDASDTPQASDPSAASVQAALTSLSGRVQVMSAMPPAPRSGFVQFNVDLDDLASVPSDAVVYAPADLTAFGYVVVDVPVDQLRGVVGEPVAVAYAESATPNDPYLSQQQSLLDTEVPAAWQRTQGSGEVVIAVVDTGIDLAHPDLVEQLWVNIAEANGTAGVDDDGNGKVDDVRGWDFANGDADPTDDNGHGTSVAGVAAAATGNGTGIAGVCGRCRIMPVKVAGAHGVGGSPAIVAGIKYAVDQGADVINLSMGGDYSSDYRHAVAYAGDRLLIAAAGNDGVTEKRYPAALATGEPNVLAVSAAAPGNPVRRASFSQYGDWVTVAAPGDAILTTEWSSGASGYGWSSGTSLAAPHVAGIAGLALSLDPTLTAAELVAAAIASADPADFVRPGSGRVHAGRWLDAAVVDAEPEPAPAPGPAPAPEPEPAPAPGPAPAPEPEPGLAPDPSASPAPAPFPDVAASGTHAAAIGRVRDDGIAGGYPDGTFRPALVVNRAQMATFLERLIEAAGGGLTDGSAGFDDVTSSPHADAIRRLAASEIVAGTGAGRFEPHAAVSRAQMATFLVRAVEHLTGEPIAVTHEGFVDVDGAHAESIAKVASLGITTGVGGGRYAPLEPVSRGQMATFLVRTLDANDG